jgi:poly(hydroxyalkanoate) depolymerase family esterase
MAAIEVVGFGTNPGNLKMHIHVPDQVKHSHKNVPIVIALHGCSQSAKTLEKQSGWSELADKHNFIVIYPEQKKVNNAFSCFKWYDYGNEELKEVESINQMIAYTKRNYQIDTNNVFIYGLSAGAVMTIHMLIHSPNIFKAGASLAGGPYKIGEPGLDMLMELAFLDDKSPKEWAKCLSDIDQTQKFPKLILGHGTKDGLVNVQNSFEIIDQFSNLYNIDVIEDSVVTDYANNPLIEKRYYQNQAGENFIKLYLIGNTGHALPVDPGTGPYQGGKTGAFAVDRDFFSTYYIAKDFGLISENQDLAR